MIESISAALISPLRQSLIEDMELRHFSIETKRNYKLDRRSQILAMLERGT